VKPTTSAVLKSPNKGGHTCDSKPRMNKIKPTPRPCSTQCWYLFVLFTTQTVTMRDTNFFRNSTHQQILHDPLIPVLRHKMPVHTFTPYFSHTIQYFSPHMSTSLKWSSAFTISTETLLLSFYFPIGVGHGRTGLFVSAFQ